MFAKEDDLNFEAGITQHTKDILKALIFTWSTWYSANDVVDKTSVVT